MPRSPALLIAASLALVSSAGPRLEAAGLVVEAVKPGLVAAAAGLRAGDLLLAWRLERSSGEPAAPEVPLTSPYDLVPLTWEEAPLHPVVLRGRRGAEPKEWSLRTSDWGLETRPDLPEEAAVPYLEGLRQLAGGAPGEVAATERGWRAALAALDPAGDRRVRLWLLERLARVLTDAGRGSDGDALYAQALALVDRETEPRLAVTLLRDWGFSYDQRSLWDEARARDEEALELTRRLDGKSLTEALILSRLGIMAAKRGDIPTADRLLRQCLALREELAPGSTEVAGSLNNLGILARRSGDLDAAEGYLKRGEELLTRVAPRSMDRGLFAQNLSNVEFDRGDLDRAEEYALRAVQIFEQAAPEGIERIDCLHLLAQIALERGDLARADAMLRRLLKEYSHPGVNPLDLAMVVVRMGLLEDRRGDFEAAVADFRRAATIQEKLSPEGQETAVALQDLGLELAKLGRYPEALGFLRRALAINEKAGPESLGIAPNLEQLGRLELDSHGRLDRAESYLNRALRFYERMAPRGLDYSRTLVDLAGLDAARGHPAAALTRLREVVSIRRRITPATSDEAEALHLLGGAERRAGLSKEGTGHLCQAVEVLDRQRARVGAASARTTFESGVGPLYLGCLAARLEDGDPAGAFRVLEQGRARSFLTLLAGRDLRPTELPPELAVRRRQIDAQYDRTQAQLRGLAPGRDDAEIDRIGIDLRQIQAQQDEILDQVRQQSPRLAAVQDPQPLDLEGARAALDPGTVLVEYAAGETGSWAFVVRSAASPGPGLQVFPLASGKAALRREVASLLRLLGDPRSDRAALRARSRRLYDLLVAPFDAELAGAKRLLISPDGPLRTLPFAPLLHGDLYLVERLPLHEVLSATVYAELKRARHPESKPADERVAAFGDPLYPAAAGKPFADPVLREAVRRGLGFGRLPATRSEVESIASLFPNTRAYLGAEATEGRAKALGTGDGIVHFACHGFVDERLPLNSALALSLPETPREGEENGLLQAWEILESVRLDADLVTLSACDSGRGREMGGEGLVGLVRAFQVAGARSVVASQWSVADASTARLMRRFYASLRAGKSKDEALRQAQIEILRADPKRPAHPFHWAAFELFGDWR